jgi:hypothetical protein
MAKPVPERSWWTTLPGVLTGVAALLTAVTGLLALLLPLLHNRSEPGPTDASRQAAVPGVLTAPASPERRDPATGGQQARPADAEPRRTTSMRSAIPAQANQQVGPPPLVLGERLEVADTFFEVLNLESTSPRGGVREIRVTFRVTAGSTDTWLASSNVRILTPGRIHTPVEGVSAAAIRAGTRHQFWVRFEIEEPVRDPVLSFTDNMSAPRGEVRRALTRS